MDVTIFTTTTCAFCKVEKEWLDRKGIKYIARNIDEDEAAREFMTELGYSGFPVTIVGDNIVQGFNRPKLIELLGL